MLYGVDFSAVLDAGKKIWIAQSSIAAGRLQIVDRRRAPDFLGSSFHRESCLAALSNFIIK